MGRPQAGWLLPAPPRPASPKASPPQAPSVTMPLGSGMAGVGARRRAADVGGAPRLARRCPEGATGRKDVVGPPGLRVPAVGPTVAGRWERDRAWAWVRATKRVLGAWCGCPRGCGVVQGAGSWGVGRMCKGECVTLPDPTGSHTGAPDLLRCGESVLLGSVMKGVAASRLRRAGRHTPSGRALSMTTGGAVGGLAGDLLGSLDLARVVEGRLSLPRSVPCAPVCRPGVAPPPPDHHRGLVSTYVSGSFRVPR